MNGLNYLQLQYEGCKMEASFGLMSIGNPIAATRVGVEQCDHIGRFLKILCVKVSFKISPSDFLGSLKTLLFR